MNTKADLVLHPIRMRILLNLSGAELTPLELVAQLDDVAQATLYRHLKELVEAGLVEVVEERQVRGTVEKIYTLAGGGADLSADDLSSATKDDHMRFFTIFVSTLLADFSAYLDGDDIDLLTDGVGYRQVPLNLTDEELEKLVFDLNQIFLPLLSNKLEGNRRRRKFTTILMPAAE